MSEILSDYERWLHHTANSLLPVESPEHDDLVQEGRIAMWRALGTYDETRGALPSWLTGAARLRMRDFAHGTGQPTGHVSMRGRRPVAETPLEPFLEVDENFGPAAWDVYPDHDVIGAVLALPVDRRDYVLGRFWGDQERPDRWRWPRARALLREALSEEVAA